MVVFIKLFVFISFYTIILQQDDIFHFPSRNSVFISEFHFIQISIYLYINKYSSKHVTLIKKWINYTPTCHASSTIMDKIKSPNKQFIAISILNFIFALPFLFRFKRKALTCCMIWENSKTCWVPPNTNIKFADSACST